MCSPMSQVSNMRMFFSKLTEKKFVSNVGKMDGVGVLANASGSTPTKLFTNSGCLLCGSIQNHSRRRTGLNGKVANLQQRICNSLDITLAGIQLNRYICSNHCFCDVQRLQKLREDAKVLHLSLKDKFSSSNRIKRGVPSDAAISPKCRGSLEDTSSSDET